jgi:hypothetical protein
MADQTAYNDISHRYPLIAPNGDNMNNLLKKQRNKRAWCVQQKKKKKKLKLTLSSVICVDQKKQDVKLLKALNLVEIVY